MAWRSTRRFRTNASGFPHSSCPSDRTVAARRSADSSFAIQPMHSRDGRGPMRPFRSGPAALPRVDVAAALALLRPGGPAGLVRSLVRRGLGSRARPSPRRPAVLVAPRRRPAVARPRAAAAVVVALRRVVVLRRGPSR